MFIRTQDKTTLVNLEQVKEIFVIGKTVRCEHTGDLGTCRFLGTYSTEEKALKVLNSIQKYHDSNLVVYSMDGMIERVTDIPNKTFQMPEDEELEVCEITETEKELADALNSVQNYKNMLFGN